MLSGRRSAWRASNQRTCQQVNKKSISAIIAPIFTIFSLTAAEASTVHLSADSYGSISIVGIYISGTKTDASDLIDGPIISGDTYSEKYGIVTFDYQSSRIPAVEERYSFDARANNNSQIAFASHYESTDFHFVNNTDYCPTPSMPSCTPLSFDVVFSYDIWAEATVGVKGNGVGAMGSATASTFIGTGSPGQEVASVSASSELGSKTYSRQQASGEFTITVAPGSFEAPTIYYGVIGDASVTPVPVPASLPLLGSLLGVLLALRKGRSIWGAKRAA